MLARPARAVVVRRAALPGTITVMLLPGRKLALEATWFHCATMAGLVR